MTTYVLAGGCFWCLDAVYQRIRGVQSSVVGYAGGAKADANYYTVASGNSGHAEATEVSFDEAIIPKEIILDIFFLIHNPTTKNRQGGDVGPQYRSAMFYADSKQKADFQAAIVRVQKNWDSPIVTQLEPLTKFYEAEPEHADYYTNNPTNPYCSVVITPKVLKARNKYVEWFSRL